MARFAIVAALLADPCGGIVATDEAGQVTHPPPADAASDTGVVIDAAPAGSVLFSGNNPYTLAIDGADLYFTDAIPQPLSVMKCSTGGCASPSLVATGGSGLPGLALDATNVYWTANFANTVLTCPRTGCGSAPTTLASGQIAPHGIASDGADVYWTTDDGNVVKCAAGGCNDAPTALATGQPKPNGVAVDGTNVYWTNIYGGVMRCAKTGCNLSPTTLASSPDYGADIAVDATAVYWASASSTGSGVYRCAISGCSETPAMLATGAAYALAIDDVNVYWTTVDSVMKCAKTGCSQPTAIASGQTNPADVAVDATSVYWTNRAGAGEIRTLPK